MQDKTVHVNNINIQVREYPNGADTILFLHFGGGNLMMWEGVVPFLKDKFHLVMIDLRGHGKSSRPERGYHIETLAGDVLEVLKQLGVKSFHLVGSSLGAEIGLVIASKESNMVKSLLCEGALYSEFGPYGIFDGSIDEFNQFVEKQLKDEETRDVYEYDNIESLIKCIGKLNQKYNTWNEYVEGMERHGAFLNENDKYIGGMSKSQILDYIIQRQAMEKMSSMSSNIVIKKTDNWIHAYSWMVNPEKASVYIKEFIQI